MATNLLTFRATGIHACAIPGRQKPADCRRNDTSSSSSANWLTPLFGWSSEPDYIDADNKTEAEPGNDLGQKPPRSTFKPGRFTEEKARQLRMMTNSSSSFHDVMYHSAIASRLASDFKGRSDQ